MINISAINQTTKGILFGSDIPEANAILNVVTLAIDDENIDYVKLVVNGIEVGVLKIV